MSDQHHTSTDDSRLDSELKAKWLKALRSGKYQQGQKALQPKPGCFCCLGVLADIADPNGWSDHGELHWHAEADKYGEYDEDRSTELPHDFTEQIHLSQQTICKLVEMNDGRDKIESSITQGKVIVEPLEPKSFAEIADYIEANL